jgi:glycosyltransferase A (GT-A) superfamily protein (DUF2064 family)
MSGMPRFLVLFAREPRAQAREKGLASPAAAALFRDLAAGWIEAARAAGAAVIVSAPPEDLPGWRRSLRGHPGLLWFAQRGSTLGARLEDSARRAAGLGGHAVVAGGDVPPSEAALRDAFEALEAGAAAVLSPAVDGGVSLLALSEEDLDVLGRIRPRRRTVLRELLRELRLRGRRVALVEPAADLDGRRRLRPFLRLLPAGSTLRCLVRLLLARPVALDGRRPAFLASRGLVTPCGLRAPPVLLAA